jgi:hypothetical protein
MTTPSFKKVATQAKIAKNINSLWHIHFDES